MDKDTSCTLGSAVDRILPDGNATRNGTTEGEPAPAGRQAIVERLKRKYGLGPKPKARMAFYRRLQHAVDVHGDPAYEIISEVVQAAESAGTRSHLYFCKAVKLRLDEHGYLPGSKTVSW